MVDTKSIRRRNSGVRNTYRLALKELKEILRDRRTIITLVVMPLLIYPLLSILLQKFYLASGKNKEEVAYTYAFDQSFLDSKGNEVSVEETNYELLKDDKLVDFFLTQYVNLGEAYAFPELQFPPRNLIPPLTEENCDPNFVRKFEPRYFENNQFRELDEGQTLEEMVTSGQIDCGIRIIRGPRRSGKLEIVQLESGASANAAVYLRKRIDLTNLIMSRLQVARAGAFWLGRDYATKSLEGEQSSSGAISMSSLVPLILILMTVTGAVYPAIDLTAGERERGTLEALIAAPVPRFQVLFAKFIGVLTVAMLTAIVNMVGMFSTLAVFGLLPLLFGDGAFGWLPIFQIFGLLLLFAGFFSAVLLAVTSFARSFKEAQAYIIPVTLLSITPGVIALTPGLELSGVLTVIPLINIVLLAREIMEGNATYLPAIVAITSTTLYGVAALSVAASIFGSDSILYGSQSSWRSMIRRPADSTGKIPISKAMACLAVLFPLSFVSLALVGRVPAWVASLRGIKVEDVGYWTQLVPFTVSTFFVFVVVPSLFLWHGRIRWAESLGFRWPSFLAVVGAILIGISLWPLTGQLVESVNQLSQSGAYGEPSWREELLAKAKEIVQKWRTLPAWIIVGCFSVVPAVCEEIFFRGVLLRSLAARNKPWVAIGLSALIFGIFHTLSLTDLASQKFLPSFLAGLFLAWIALRSGSIWPGIILHVLNNGILVSLAYYEDRLVEAGWIDSDQSGFPAWGLASAAVGVLAGSLTVAFLVKPSLVKPSKEAPSEKE